jgi:hypothetical protein
MSIGWLIIHRELMDKPIWKGSTPEQKVVLMTLLMMVDFKPSEWEWNGEKYSTKPGEKITSLQSIVSLAGKGISIQNVRSSLKRFEKLEFLTNQPTRQGRLISIINWDSYQSTQHSTQHSTQQRPNKGPTPNEQGNKETKKQEEPIPPEKPGGDRDPLEKFSPEIIDFVTTFNGYIDGKFEKSAPKRTDKSFVADCNSVRLAMKVDGFSLDDIKSSLGWAHRDSFWHDQMMSLSQMRKKGNDGTSKLQKIYAKSKSATNPQPQMSFSQAAQGERCKEIG